MEDQPVEIIREYSRSILMVNRRACRDEETNVRRNIVSQNVTQAVIADIANRLKSKSAVSVSDLRTLKNGLLENPQYTEIVLNTQGAVRGLVRELTGQGSRQCVAADCLCNLSLGEERASAAVAKAAGLYLLAALDSLNVDLAITCAWTLGNMAGSGARAVSLMMSQGAVAKLAGLMTSPSDDVVDAAASALAHFAHQMGDDFRQEHVLLILQSLSQKKLTKSSLQLLFILSCHRDFNESMNEELLYKIIETTLKCMENITENCWDFVAALVQCRQF
ncbi:hypothetical protein MSG28_010019 [Choristoneura fumiferana]|uniref:Uncharacterized protein n=1 Tax=Choristoneura fumiferana TaxID=7141 RepID=A0ACC0KIR5_CHOFU|nr:hypothetical protein MSG28_010019 [Choristoneura fumiferana]